MKKHPAELARVISKQDKSNPVVDLYRSWTLVRYLCARDIKSRFKNSTLGLSWIVLQPAIMTLVFTAFLGRIVKLPSEGIPYPLFAFSGLALWTYLAGSISAGSQCLIANHHILSKVYVPKIAFPATAVLNKTIDLAVTFSLLIGLIVLLDKQAAIRLAPVALALLLTAALVFALCVLTSIVTVFLRDFVAVIPLGLQAWMFASPIVYSVDIVPERYRIAYDINPMVGIMSCLRSGLFGTPLNCKALALSLVIATMLVATSLLVFRSLENHVNDRI